MYAYSSKFGVGQAMSAVPDALRVRANRLLDAISDYVLRDTTHGLPYPRLDLIQRPDLKVFYMDRLGKARRTLNGYILDVNLGKVPVSQLTAYVTSQEAVLNQLFEIIEADIADPSGARGDETSQRHLAAAVAEREQRGEIAAFANTILGRVEGFVEAVSKIPGAVVKAATTTLALTPILLVGGIAAAVLFLKSKTG